MSRHIVTSYNQIQFYALTVADTFWPQSDHKGSNISLGQPQHHGLACSLKQNPYLSNATYRSSATIIYRQCQKRFHHCWPEKGHVWHRCFASQDPDANRLHKLLARLVDSEAWVLTNTIVGLHVCFFLLLVLEFQDVHPNVSRATRLPAGCVVVSSNAEQYRIVDVSGAPDGSCIRERILSKLCIPDNAHPNFSIYQSEIGSFAIGVALSNTSLFELCRDYGDASGSLKFFVSTSPDRPPPPDQAGASPTSYMSIRRF